MNTFEGPLFLVGRPRSGTKLLRGLLNLHSQIQIPSNESKIIPHFLKHRNRFGDLTREREFRGFYRQFTASGFALGLRKGGFHLTRQEWQDKLPDGRVESALAAFLTAYSRAHGKGIWGDKTPGYERHVLLLREAFPSAKFVCIWRDPRDCVLSVRRAWGKDPGRVAQRWNDSWKTWRAGMAALPDDVCLEVRYEDLVDHPEEILGEIQQFLDLPRERLVSRLSKATENLGSARDQVGVVEGNYGKWKSGLSRPEVLLVEEVAFEGMAAMGYSPSLATSPRRLSGVEMRLRQLKDGVGLWRYHTGKLGLREGVRHLVRSYLHSSSRIEGGSEEDASSDSGTPPRPAGSGPGGR